jgi:hypothetical protein
MLVDITSNTFDKHTATFQMHCIRHPEKSCQGHVQVVQLWVIFLYLPNLIISVEYAVCFYYSFGLITFLWECISSYNTGISGNNVVHVMEFCRDILSGTYPFCSIGASLSMVSLPCRRLAPGERACVAK